MFLLYPLSRLFKIWVVRWSAQKKSKWHCCAANYSAVTLECCQVPLFLPTLACNWSHLQQQTFTGTPLLWQLPPTRGWYYHRDIYFRKALCKVCKVIFVSVRLTKEKFPICCGVLINFCTRHLSAVWCRFCASFSLQCCDKCAPNQSIVCTGHLSVA